MSILPRSSREKKYVTVKVVFELPTAAYQNDISFLAEHVKSALGNYSDIQDIYQYDEDVERTRLFSVLVDEKNYRDWEAASC